MVTHKEIWSAIDALAAENRLSASGLARLGGLDPTAFNVSKRYSREGKARWPSTESIAKILEATGATLDEFARLCSPNSERGITNKERRVPITSLALAATHGLLDSNGAPQGDAWDEMRFPDLGDPKAFALEVAGASLEPVYRDGDVILISPAANVRRHDRVLLKLKDGGLLAGRLVRKGAKQVALDSFVPSDPPRMLNSGQVEWLARIVWASQ